MAVMTYLVRLSISELVEVTVVKSGPFHTVFTVTGTSTAGLNSTVQVRLGEEPAIIVPTGVATFTVNGSVTKKHDCIQLVKGLSIGYEKLGGLVFHHQPTLQ